KPTDVKGSTYLGELKHLSADLSIEDNVRFDVGFIPEERVPSYISAASVLLIPYTESVGASGPIHSFAAYGVPIVASDKGHHMPEALGGNLVLFSAGSSEDLSLKLYSALTDSSRTREMVERQIAYASRETWELAGKRTLQNYRITLGGKR
ncbi:MAG: glycosyltransferase, partial [Candidatus Thorarchaeota archaeon]